MQVPRLATTVSLWHKKGLPYQTKLPLFGRGRLH